MSISRSVRAAALDIGTNTVVLLVADVTAAGLTPLFGRSKTARLGAGARADGTLAPESIARAVAAATEFVAEARSADVAAIYMIGTAAVRDAPNRDDLLRQIEREAGVACRVVSGDEEADLTFLGATAGESLDGALAVGDIGGGSTERIVAVNGTIRERRSLPLGSGRLTERVEPHDPPTRAEADTACASPVRPTASSMALIAASCHSRLPPRLGLTRTPRAACQIAPLEVPDSAAGHNPGTNCGASLHISGRPR